MKRFFKRNYIIFILLALTVFASLFNSPDALIDTPAKNLGGIFTIAIVLIWITALFKSMHKIQVMLFSIIFWSIFIITSILMLSFNKANLPVALSVFFTFSLKIFYSSLYGVTHWLNNINISVLALLVSLAFLMLSFIFLKKGRCKLYELE